MKYENLMLRSLFVACLLVCTSVLGSMLTAHPGTARTLATNSSACATTVATCPLPRG